MATKKLEWLFHENDQIFSVDPNCEDYEKYGMLSFALIRYKDIVSHTNTESVVNADGILHKRSPPGASQYYPPLQPSLGGGCRVLLNKLRHKVECYNDYGEGIIEWHEKSAYRFR